MSIEVVDLVVRYGSRTIIDGASATFPTGKVTVVMGPSGSGKSTLFAALAGAAVISSGEIRVDSPSSDVQWIVQTTPLLQQRRVFDNAQLSMLIRGVGSEEARLRAARALKAVGVLHLAREVTHRLSGGEKQRVAVARAMATQSPLVLADEPTASLDAPARDSVCLALRAAARAGAAVVVATHDFAVARQADRVLHLRSGKLWEKDLSDDF